MKNFSLLLCLIVVGHIEAQTWFPAEAVYTSSSYLGGIEKITVEGEQDYEGTTYTALSRDRIEINHFLDTVITNIGTLLMRTEGDQVINNDGQGEQVIYDFGMEVGDSLEWFRIQDNCDGTFHLDSLFTTELNGKSIRVQEGRIESDGFSKGRYRIYEGIGVTERFFAGPGEWTIHGFLLPQIGITCLQDYIPPLICSFESNDFSLSRDQDCDALRPNLAPWFYFPHEKWKMTFSAMDSLSQGHRFLENANIDTIFEDNLYHVITNTKITLVGASDSVEVAEQPFYVRSDTGKVYYWDKEAEHLIYDMTMRIGDTIAWRPQVMEENMNEDCEAYFVLDSLDYQHGYFAERIVQFGRVYQEYLNSETRIRIDEGAGFSYIYNETSQEWEIGGHLIPDRAFQCVTNGVDEGSLCYWKGDGVSIGNEEECFDLVSNIQNEPKNLVLEIYPNPSQDRLYVRGELNEIEQMSILDMLGRSMKVLSPSELVNIDELSPSIYFLYVEYKNGTTAIQSFLKI